MEEQNPDVNGWERLPGTDAGAYYRIGVNVVLAVPVPGYVQDGASAERSLEAFDLLALRAGRKQSIVIAVDRVGSQSSEARRVWARSRERETRAAQALICKTLLARAIGSFFLGLNKAAIPTRMFATMAEAAKWAEEMAQTNGGPLE